MNTHYNLIPPRFIVYERNLLAPLRARERGLRPLDFLYLMILIILINNLYKKSTFFIFSVEGRNPPRHKSTPVIPRLSVSSASLPIPARCDVLVAFGLFSSFPPNPLTYLCEMLCISKGVYPDYCLRMRFNNLKSSGVFYAWGPPPF